jgi:hypothetical protein
MPASFIAVNLESGRPSVEEARRTLRFELERAKAENAAVVKIIHGYGSSGVGGALRKGIRVSLVRRKKECLIREIVFGEHWSIFNECALKLLEECPELRKDRDLCNSNPGVSIVLI